MKDDFAKKAATYRVKSVQGVSLVEYGILAGLIATLSVGAVLSTGVEVSDLFSETGSELDGAVSVALQGAGGGSAAAPQGDPCALYFDQDNPVGWELGTEGNDSLAMSGTKLNGLAGNDSIMATNGNDLIYGSTGNDNINARYTGGDDTYLYALGDGVDVLDERGSGGGNDSVVFCDLNLADVKYEVYGTGWHIKAIAPDGGEIQNVFGGYNRIIENYTFADGTTLDLAGVLAKAFDDSKADGVVELSYLGDSVYHTASTDGSYWILGPEEGVDTLTFTETSFADARFKVTSISQQSLQITLPDGDEILINFGLFYDPGAIENLVFADGSTPTTQEVRDRAANDAKETGTVILTKFDDNITHHASADGSYQVTGQGGGVDSITFAETNAADAYAWVMNDFGDNLGIRLPDGDVVEVNDGLYYGASSILDQYAFADTTFDLDGMRDKAMEDQKSGGAVKASRGGDQHYHSQATDGSYTISGSRVGSDAIHFTDVNYTDVSFSMSGNTLQIQTPDGDVISFLDWGTYNDRMEVFDFPDFDPSASDIQARISAGG